MEKEEGTKEPFGREKKNRGRGPDHWLQILIIKHRIKQ